ncbi:hypothetical protein AB0F72_08560 [Actinoplanes sp. NPDC023936]|uniref:hypothetical protein n=1 Tax=Actinoplanes sp. NPDC023936 TaxID=3154910 RepID=UPI0033E59805
MQQAEVLDVMKRLFEAAAHPDIAEVRVYGAGTKESPGGVAVKDQRNGSTYLVASPWKGETPVDVPEQLPPPKLGVQRIAVLAVRLLDAARPAQFQAWRLVALPDLGPTDARGTTPAGVSIKCADGTNVLLRAMHGGSQTGDPAEDPHPDWQIPAGITV